MKVNICFIPTNTGWNKKDKMENCRKIIYYKLKLFAFHIHLQERLYHQQVKLESIQTL